MERMRRRLFALTWAIVGFALAWFAIGWMGLSTYCDPGNWQQGNSCQIVKFLHDWQDLLGGLAAIAAAFVGGSYILKQIAYTRAQDETRARKEHASARSMLPLALASISKYAAACSTALKKLHAASSGQAIPKSALQSLVPPRLPHDAISELKPLVQAAGEDVGLAIADMLGEIQVLDSRLTGLIEPRDSTSVHVVVVAFLEDIILNALKVYARASSLYDYGRRKSEEIPTGEPKPEALYSAMHNLGFFDDRYETLRQTIERRARQSDKAT